MNREETHARNTERGLLAGVCASETAPRREEMKGREDKVEQLESARDARGIYPPRGASRLFIRASMLSRTASSSSILMVAARQP